MAKEARFERLMREGMAMPAALREECVRRLLMDEAAAGLMGFLQGLREDCVRASCGPEMADMPGKQSHAWGGVYALEGVLEAMRGIEARGARARKEAEQASP